MTKNTQDEAHIATRLAEAIKSINAQKLGKNELVRMAATYAIGYFDLQRLVETQEQTIDKLMTATSIQAKGLKAADVDAAENAKFKELASTVFKEYLAQAEAIDAFSPLSSLDGEAREILIESNTAAWRIDAGIKLKKSKDAKAKGAKGAAKRNEPRNKLREFAIREYKKKKWPSLRKASRDRDLLSLIMEESIRLRIKLSDANKEDTVYKWLLNDNRKAKVHK